MTRADGSVVIKASVDVDQAEKDLAKLKRDIAKTEQDIEEMTGKREEADQDAIFSAAALDAEKAKLQEMKKQLEEIRAVAKDTTLSPSVRAEAQAAIPGQREAVTEQQQRVSAMQREYNTLAASVERYDSKLKDATAKLERQKNEAGELIARINSVSKASRAMADAQKKAAKNLDTFRKRLGAVVRSALVFTVITQALAKLRNWIGETVKASSEARQAFARLKGSLLTLAQPLVDVLVPAITAFANVLAYVINNLADMFAVFLGKNPQDIRDAAEALDKEKDALEGVEDAASGAAKSMARFDTINKLSTKTAQSSSASSGVIAPDFSAADESWLDGQLDKVAGYVRDAMMLAGVAMVAIGAAKGSLLLVALGAALAWSGTLPWNVTEEGLENFWDVLKLTNVKQWASAAVTLAGIACIAIGAAKADLLLLGAGALILELGTHISASDESGGLENWVDVLGLKKVAGWVTAALTLLGIALTVAGIVTGNIIMILSGASLLNAGVKTGESTGTFTDWMNKIGADIQKVNSWLTAGLLLAGIAGIVIACFTANIPLFIASAALLGTGIAAGQTTGAFNDWISEIKAGIDRTGTWGNKVKTLVGISAVIIGLLTGNKETIRQGAEWLGYGINDPGEGTLEDKLDEAAEALLGYRDVAIRAFVGMKNGITDPALTFEERITQIGQSFALFVTTVKYWALELINALEEVFEPSWTLNFGYKLGETIGGLFTSKIPGLATGSVVPPNREFLAVLGDNKQETEVVSPLSTIKQALREVYGEMGGGGGQSEAVMEIDGEVFARLVYRLNSSESRRVGVRLIGEQA